jgi:hypothetical protein
MCRVLARKPLPQFETKIYAVRGKVDFFGEQAMIRVGGAGGPVCTVRATKFSLPIAA